MKQPMKKLLSLALASSMVLGMATTAQAAFQDFTDVKGHWAEATLQTGLRRRHSARRQYHHHGP